MSTTSKLVLAISCPRFSSNRWSPREVDLFAFVEHIFRHSCATEEKLLDEAVLGFDEYSPCCVDLVASLRISPRGHQL